MREQRSEEEEVHMGEVNDRLGTKGGRAKGLGVYFVCSVLTWKKVLLRIPGTPKGCIGW